MNHWALFNNSMCIHFNYCMTANLYANMAQVASQPYVDASNASVCLMLL